MSIAQKTQTFVYIAKNLKVGLSDIKGQLYLGSTPKSTGANSLLFTELDSVNAPGVYVLTVSAATLQSYGLLSSGENALILYANSVSYPAAAATKYDVTIASTDDIANLIGSSTTGSITSDIASVKSDTSAVKADLETGAASLQTILSAVQKIQSNAGFAIPLPSQLISNASGTNTYVIPITIYNETNQLVDPDGQIVTVGLTNQAGTDRGGYIQSSSGSPAIAQAVRKSLGQYQVTVNVPSSAPQEEVLLTSNYTINGAAIARTSTSQVTTSVAAQGFALQNTLLGVQSTVQDSNARLQDVQSYVENATYGLQSASTLQNNILNQTQTTNSILNNASYGNNALKSAILQVLGEITGNLEGTGFNTASDSLHAISQFQQQQGYTQARLV